MHYVRIVNHNGIAKKQDRVYIDTIEPSVPFSGLPNKIYGQLFKIEHKFNKGKNSTWLFHWAVTDRNTIRIVTVKAPSAAIPSPLSYMIKICEAYNIPIDRHINNAIRIANICNSYRQDFNIHRAIEVYTSNSGNFVAPRKSSNLFIAKHTDKRPYTGRTQSRLIETRFIPNKASQANRKRTSTTTRLKHSSINKTNINRHTASLSSKPALLIDSSMLGCFRVSKK